MPPSLHFPHPEELLLRRSLPGTAPLSKGPIEDVQTREQDLVESWGQGFNVGSVVILILIVLCNYRKRVLLHKLILIELFFALWHATFIFVRDPVYGWYVSSTATLLYISYTLHNIVSWLKIRPFLLGWGGRLFIISLLMVQPFWILHIFANFEYFNSLSESRIFHTTRYLEAPMRDPWWIFTTVRLCIAIKTNYELSFFDFLKASPRFAVLLSCMFVSIVFLVMDVIVSVKVSILPEVTTESGINPFWRLALVFKCASDTIFLDDFKSVLDQIVRSFMARIANIPETDYDPSDNSHGATSRHLSFSRSRGHRENHESRISIPSRSRPAASHKKPSKRFWRRSRKLDSSSGRRREDTPESIRKPSESGDSSSDVRSQIQKLTTIEYQEPKVGEGRRAGHRQDPGRNPTDSAEEILPRYSSGNKRSAPVVADFEWAMAQEEMVRRGTLDGDSGTRGIPMRPMKARTTG